MQTDSSPLLSFVLSVWFTALAPAPQAFANPTTQDAIPSDRSSRIDQPETAVQVEGVGLFASWRSVPKTIQNMSSLPEPASLSLLGLGIAGMVWRLRRSD